MSFGPIKRLNYLSTHTCIIWLNTLSHIVGAAEYSVKTLITFLPQTVQLKEPAEHGFCPTKCQFKCFDRQAVNMSILFLVCPFFIYIFLLLQTVQPEEPVERGTGQVHVRDPSLLATVPTAPRRDTTDAPGIQRPLHQVFQVSHNMNICTTFLL